jgi:hypothetical protein
MYVQFSDAAKATIISIFSGPQDPTVWANQGEVEGDDLRYIAYFDTLLPSAQAMLIPPSS